MSDKKAFHEYIEFRGAKLFTAVGLPEYGDKFPVVIFRNPYVDSAEGQSEEQVVNGIAETHRVFTDNCYAVVFQHCRGRGKSTGDCVPYINEREDEPNSRYDIISVFTPEFTEDAFIKGKMRVKLAVKTEGLFSEQKTAKIANNTILLNKSELTVNLGE